MPASAQRRFLHRIAEDIQEDWTKPFYAAVPYIESMRRLAYITDNDGQDSAKSVVLYFLNNASTWRGETARAVKAELREMVK